MWRRRGAKRMSACALRNMEVHGVLCGMIALVYALMVLCDYSVFSAALIRSFMWTWFWWSSRPSVPQDCMWVGILTFARGLLSGRLPILFIWYAECLLFHIKLLNHWSLSWLTSCLKHRSVTTGTFDSIQMENFFTRYLQSLCTSDTLTIVFDTKKHASEEFERVLWMMVPLFLGEDLYACRQNHEPGVLYLDADFTIAH